MIELDYICDQCDRLVDDGEGCIIVRFVDIHDWRARDAEWREAFPGFAGMTAKAILASPDPVPWRIHHDACNPRPDLDGYDFDVKHVRTYRALLDKTSYLMSKQWLPLTDWHHVIGGAADHGQRIVPHQQGDAA